MAARDFMLKGLREWLMGPSMADESFGDYPSLVYSCGMLFPDNSKLDSDQNEATPDDGSATDSSGIEGIPNLTNAMKPSAAGFSFSVAPDARKIRIGGSFALYLPRRHRQAAIIGGDNPNAGNDAVQPAANRRRPRAGAGGHVAPQQQVPAPEPDQQPPGNMQADSWNSNNVRWHRNQIDFAFDLHLDKSLTNKRKVSELLHRQGMWMAGITNMERLEIDHVVDKVEIDLRVTDLGTHKSVTCTLVNRVPCPDFLAKPDANGKGDQNQQGGNQVQQADTVIAADRGPWLDSRNSNSQIANLAEKLPYRYKALMDKATIYQVDLFAESASKDQFPFVEAPIRRLFTDDPDALQHALLYRRKREIAVGHGAGSNWEGPSPDGKAFSRVKIDFIPSEKVLGLNADGPGLGHDVLGMKVLAGVLGLDQNDLPVVGGGGGDQAVIQACTALVDAYEAWVNAQEPCIDGAIAELRTIEEPRNAHALIKGEALKNLGLCREAIRRMRAGVACLGSNQMAMRVFNMANLAMLMQARRGWYIKKNNFAIQPAWRPFQLAFLLMSIRSIVEPDSMLPTAGNGSAAANPLRERDIVDLIWFPTGGGKTEAYLGLMAITLIHRRLRYPGNPNRGAGVGVITRYTLRLLTSQQFERATRMICALEVLRLSPAFANDLGTKPFKIGLYVGGDSSPNDFRTTGDGYAIQPGANEVIHNIRTDNENANKGRDVRHLRKCPWCGREFNIRGYNPDYVVVNAAGRDLNPNDTITEKESALCSLQFRCRDNNCFFRHGLGRSIPAQIIDEEILREPPSVIIGTVDKFAMLAWKKESLILFGRDLGGNILYPSPDLVIQDELHLISGPLGTIVGAYEAGIGKICTSNETLEGSASPLGRPKVIGATATIRRSEEQIRSLFSRESRQFPPQGLTEGDSFFAKTEDQGKPGRLYVGVQMPAQSAKSAYLKTGGALLGLKDEIKNGLGEIIPVHSIDNTDAFHTLVGYFNSLRELSGASVVAQDDLTNYLKTKKNIRRQIHGLKIDDGNPATIIPVEMNSRRKAGEITGILQGLELKEDNGNSIRILHATNMISVGVDVDRLGLMLINGMPKNTAEYIQASSRVGRQGPGLVICVHGWTKSRDRSHYERFKQYHQAFYREVEATSVTPWTSSVRDSVLGAVIAMTYRHLSGGSAGNLPPNSNDAVERFIGIAQKFLEDVGFSDSREVGPSSQFIDAMRLKISNYAISHGAPATYGNLFQYNPHHFLRNSAPGRNERHGLIPAPTSMRDVENTTLFTVYP
jgi:hypothetical protein